MLIGEVHVLRQVKKGIRDIKDPIVVEFDN